MTIISVVEFSIMNGLIFFHIELNPLLEAAVDTILLSLFSTPLLYVWVLRPYRGEQIYVDRLPQ